MKKVLLLSTILLFLSGAASATITPIGGGNTVYSGLGTQTITIPCVTTPGSTYFPCTAGDVVVLGVKFGPSGGQAPTCYDNNYHTVFPGPQIFGYESSTSWIMSYAAVVSPGTTSYSCSTAVMIGTSITAGEFSGVLGFNLLMANNTGSGTGPTASLPSLTTDDAGDYVVCILGTDTGNAMTVEAGTTQLEAVTSTPTQVMGYVTSSSPGTVS